MNDTLSKLGRLLSIGLALAAADAGANDVKFLQGPTIQANTGSTFTVDAVGEGFFMPPEGAAFSLSWDASVLTLVSAVAADPPWDVSSIDLDYAGAGLIDYVFLNRTGTGILGSNFSLASFTFTFIGGPETATTLALGVDVYNAGFVSSFGQPIAVNFVNTDVLGPPAPVPAPATPWLLACGLPALLNRSRRRNAGLASRPSATENANAAS